MPINDDNTNGFQIEPCIVELKFEFQYCPNDKEIDSEFTKAYEKDFGRLPKINKK